MANTAWMQLSLVAALVVCGPARCAERFFPDTGKVAITQRALDLRGRLRVMSVALRPGEEDCATLAFLRMTRGALVTSVYVTNGEKGDLDTEELLPFDAAAVRRTQAMRAMSFAGADAVFLNMTDLDAAPAAGYARTQWNMDTLGYRLRRVIEPLQPDLVVLMSDKREGQNSAGTSLLREALARVRATAQWREGAILIEDSGRGTRICNRGDRHPAVPATFGQIADSIRSFYATMPLQMARLKALHPATYAVFPPGTQNVIARNRLVLAGTIPDSLRDLDRRVKDLAAYALRSPSAGRELVSRILPVLQRIDRSLARLAQAQAREKRIILDWKDAIEDLRAAALGVTVKYSLEYDVVCERQLVRLSLDEIHARSPLGAMEVVVHDVARGWILNESPRTRVPVAAGDTLRLISPAQVEYDIPFPRNAQDRRSVGRALALSLIHPGATREETFVYRIMPRIFFAPRFIAEVLTPVVRGFTGERVITRLANTSRDRVADLLEVRDSLAVSTVRRVALSFKGATSTDTLLLRWQGGSGEGSHLLPLVYGGVPVAQFLARTFMCQVDTALRIGVVSGWKSSALLEALRRLGFPDVHDLSGTLVRDSVLQPLQTVFLDRRSLTLRRLAVDEQRSLLSFVSDGGNLVILPQESAAWNAAALWQPLRLLETQGLGPDAAVAPDTADALLARPNQISRADFDGWLTRRSYNALAVQPAAQGVRVPVRTSDGMPLVVTAPLGKGQITYVDLALGPQWMNVSPGAFRLLANLLSQ